jgi:hypothetical protein
VLAVIGKFTPVPYVTIYDFWFAIAAYVVLFLGNVLRGV